MRIHQRVWNYFYRHRTSSYLVKGGQAVAIGLLLAGAAPGVVGLKEAQTHARVQPQSNRAGYGQPTRVVKVQESQWGERALRYEIHSELPTSHTSLAKPTLACVNIYGCLLSKRPGIGKKSSAPGNSRILRNVFPYGQCTWWANQRYFQLHGVFVPWKAAADAWRWTFWAYQFHWRVSTVPTYGAIIDLQPWKQGAYNLGHVAIVERVLSNGHVIASTMNWGASPWKVTYVEFAPGPGVSFISQF